MILWVASNANHVDAFARPYCELERRGREGRIVSLDRFLAQGATDRARRTGLPCIELGAETRGLDFHAIPWEACLRLATALAPRIESFVAEKAPEAVVLGNDIGLLEQLFVRTAQAAGIPTLLAQDGQLGEGLLRARVPGRLLMGEGGCDAIIAYGPRGARYFRALGSSAPIHEAGAGKLEAVTQQARPSDPGRTRILLAQQCFARYDLMSDEQEQHLYREAAASFALLPGAEVLLVPHPSHGEAHRAPYRELAHGSASIDFVEDRSALELLPGCDLLAAVSSSLLFEAVLHGVPAVSLDYAWPHARDDSCGAITSLESRAGLADFCGGPEGLARARDAMREHRHAFLADVLSALGDEAAKNFSDAVEETLSGWNVGASEIGVTVALQIPEGFSALAPSAARELERQRGVEVELIEISAAADREPAVWAEAVARASHPLFAVHDARIEAPPRRLVTLARHLRADPSASAATSDAHLTHLPGLYRDRSPTEEPLHRTASLAALYRTESLRELVRQDPSSTPRDWIETLSSSGRVSHRAEPLAALDDITWRELSPSLAHSAS